MGFLKRIGSRFKKAKSIGSRIVNKTSIGLRKVGHTLDRASGIGGKIGKVVQMAGAAFGNPLLGEIGSGIGKVSQGLHQAAEISSAGHRGIEKLKKKDFKGAMGEAKQARKHADHFR